MNIQSLVSQFTSLICVTLISMPLLAKPLINFDKAELATSKSALINKTAQPESLQAYQQLLIRADKLLLVENQSVMDKGFTPPSKDKHDYLSLSRYWWPDPTKKDGLPWKRKDGYTNPDTQKGDVDKPRIEFSTKSIQALSFAYYFSGNDKYAAKGVSWIRTWFLDEATRMNPHLEYAQSVPGNNKGRRSGILDGRIIPQRVLDAITLFSTSQHWTEQDEQKMNVWLTAYLHWLTESELGKKGAEQRNNHGAWYSYQVAAISLYLNEPKKLNNAVDLAKIIFADQFAEDGSQPHELKRTRSYFYSTFNLSALTSVAMIATKADIAFWDTKAKNGATLLTGIDYLIPASNGDDWAYPSKSGVRPDYLLDSLSRIPSKLITKEQQALRDQLLLDLRNNTEKKSYQERIYRQFLLYTPSLIPISQR